MNLSLKLRVSILLRVKFIIYYIIYKVHNLKNIVNQNYVVVLKNIKIYSHLFLVLWPFVFYHNVTLSGYFSGEIFFFRTSAVLFSILFYFLWASARSMSSLLVFLDCCLNLQFTDSFSANFATTKIKWSVSSSAPM